MRRLLRTLLAIAGVIMGTGVANAAPVLHLSGWKASAGKPETFTITRVGGNGPATVTFKTSDGKTAVAPIDYTATTQTISWRSGQSTLAIAVPTFVNMAKAGQNITFTATISWSGGTSSATALIVEPAAPAPPPPVACPDGSTVPAGSTCPVVPPPPPTPPPSSRTPAFGDTVVAAKACVGSYIPDALVIGRSYKVVGMAGIRPAPGVDPTHNDGVILNPIPDDGVHRGDGWLGLWVPFDCVSLAPTP